MSQSVTQRMPFKEFQDRLLAFVRSFDEAWTDQDISRGYDAVVNEALVTGWTQQELWAESDRVFEEEMAPFIAALEA